MKETLALFDHKVIAPRTTVLGPPDAQGLLTIALTQRLGHTVYACRPAKWPSSTMMRPSRTSRPSSLRRYTSACRRVCSASWCVCSRALGNRRWRWWVWLGTLAWVSSREPIQRAASCLSINLGPGRELAVQTLQVSEIFTPFRVRGPVVARPRRLSAWGDVPWGVSGAIPSTPGVAALWEEQRILDTVKGSQRAAS